MEVGCSGYGMGCGYVSPPSFNGRTVEREHRLSMLLLLDFASRTGRKSSAFARVLTSIALFYLLGLEDVLLGH